MCNAEHSDATDTWMAGAVLAVPSRRPPANSDGRSELTDHYVRISFAAGGLLRHREVHPTMWIRLWFSDGEKLHQRAYTLVNPDSMADTTDIEFALHDGLAADWARTARSGDTIEATVLGSSFALPQPAPRGYVIVGDTASLPAINSLLAAIGNRPATIFLEAAHESDKTLPVGREVVWVDRDGGLPLADVVRAAAFDASGYFAWVACDTGPPGTSPVSSRTTTASRAVR